MSSSQLALCTLGGIQDLLEMKKNDVDKIRGDVALQTLRATKEKGYRAVVIDGGSSPDFLMAIHGLGIQCMSQSEKGMSNGRQEGFIVASELEGAEIIVWVEPEKCSFVEECLDDCIRGIDDGADIIIPERTEAAWGTYPEYQRRSEARANAHWNTVLKKGIPSESRKKFDVFFGPRVFRNEPRVLEHFLRKHDLADSRPMSERFERTIHPDRYSNATFFPIATAIQEGLLVRGIAVPYRHPVTQTAAEEQNDAMVQKRTDQTRDIVGGLVKLLLSPKYSTHAVIDTPRENPDENEDTYFMYEHEDGTVVAGIFDGATGVGRVADPYREKMATSLGVEKISGGRFASLVAQHAVEQTVILGSKESPKELLLHGAESLREELQKIGVEEENRTQVASTLGAIVALHPTGRMRFACVRADVSVLVLRASGSWEWHPKDHPLDVHEGNALSLALKNTPEDISNSLATDTEVQQFINETNRRGENVNTYGSMNGAERSTIEPWIEEGEVQLAPSDRVFLFTDGFLPEKDRRAYDSPEAFQEEQKRQRELVVQLLRTQGPRGLLSLVRRQQQEDPTCTCFPRFKSGGDDATLITVDVSARREKRSLIQADRDTRLSRWHWR